MIKLDPSKSIKMKFRLNVTGTTDRPEARIILRQDESFTGYNAVINNGIIEAVVPANEFHNGDKVSSSIEVIIGNKIYTPWKSDMMFEEQFKIEVAPLIEQEDSSDAGGIHIEQEEVTVEPLIEQEEEIVKEIKEKIKINKLEEMFNQLSRKK